MDAAFLLTVGSFLLAVELFYLKLRILADFTYSWSLFAYNFSFLTYSSWSFFAYSGKLHLKRALKDCKQRSVTVSKNAPTVSKKASPILLSILKFGWCRRAWRESSSFFLFFLSSVVFFHFPSFLPWSKTDKSKLLKTGGVSNRPKPAHLSSMCGGCQSCFSGRAPHSLWLPHSLTTFPDRHPTEATKGEVNILDTCRQVLPSVGWVFRTHTQTRPCRIPWKP